MDKEIPIPAEPDENGWYRCKVCGGLVGDDTYCKHCGQRLKWETSEKNLNLDSKKTG